MCLFSSPRWFLSPSPTHSLFLRQGSCVRLSFQVLGIMWLGKCPCCSSLSHDTLFLYLFSWKETLFSVCVWKESFATTNMNKQTFLCIISRLDFGLVLWSNSAQGYQGRFHSHTHTHKDWRVQHMNSNVGFVQHVKSSSVDFVQPFFSVHVLTALCKVWEGYHWMYFRISAFLLKWFFFAGRLTQVVWTQKIKRGWDSHTRCTLP